jgi:hypothetical protein
MNLIDKLIKNYDFVYSVEKLPDKNVYRVIFKQLDHINDNFECYVNMECFDSSRIILVDDDGWTESELETLNKQNALGVAQLKNKYHIQTIEDDYILLTSLDDLKVTLKSMLAFMTEIDRELLS